MTERGPGAFAPPSATPQQSPGVQLLTTQCRGAAWAVEADSVERIIMHSDWFEEPPLDVAHALELRPFPDGLERVLVVHGVLGAKALLSRGKLTLIELLASDVQMVPSIVYGSALGPVQQVVLEAADFPVLVFNPDSVEVASGGAACFGK